MVAILEAHRREEITHAVQAMYTAVANAPDTGFHFPVGVDAARFVGYSNALLEGVPRRALEAFAGVGCPFTAGVIGNGADVLDIGSGSGTDALIAGRMVGRRGRVLALDLTLAMLGRLDRTIEDAGITNVETLLCDAEAIALRDASVDVVTSNGAFNLVPDKRRALGEIVRVLRPGGRLHLADVILGSPVSESCRADPRLWAECVVGATLEETLVRLLREAGFRDVEILRRLDYFAASASAETRELAGALNAQAIVLRARRAPGGHRKTGHQPRVSAVRPAAKPPPPEAVPIQPMPDAPSRPDLVLEAYGQSCVRLEPLIRRCMRTLDTGQVLEVRADDPTARLGIPAWCRLTGNTLLAMIEHGSGQISFFLRRK